MPNWCENDVQISHPNKEWVDRLEESLNKEEPELLNFLRPMPEELNNTTSPSDEPNWYDWRISNWGTKWEANITHFERIDDNTIYVSFDSAWSPPLHAYEYAIDNAESDMFHLVAHYHEPGCCFVGYFENGIDECYEWESVSEMKEEVPQWLRDHFGMDEWYEEEDEYTNMMPEDKQSIEFRNWLRGHLQYGPTTVTFTKANGDERVMKATTNFELIPEEFHPQSSAEAEKTAVDKEDIDLIKCFDLEANGWRSFKPSRITKVEFSLGD